MKSAYTSKQTYVSVFGRFETYVARARHWFYQTCIKPRSSDETVRRQELIFNILMVGTLFLISTAALYKIVDYLTQGKKYEGSHPLVLTIPAVCLLYVYVRSRKRFTSGSSYILVSIFFVLGTFALWEYGYILPEGLLTYAMVIVIAGILISVRAAWIMLGAITLALIGLSYVQTNHITHPFVGNVFEPIRATAIVIHVIIFSVILLVSGLYNQDIEASLARAQKSEIALKRERNSLEIKVRKRTRELEQAHVQNLLDLNRFAEFGRLSATLLHELANPLTSVSLELEQLESKGYSQAVGRARKSVAHMEEYVIAARRQLSHQAEEKVFRIDHEIANVIAFLEPKAQAAHIAIETKLTEGATLFGDSIQFDQIISNLVANAIDASAAVTDNRKPVQVMAIHHDKSLIVQVKDCGVGIPANELRRIFEPFYTTKNSERGTGIGLYITEQAVHESFKGTIKVTSSKRYGTVFTVELPVHE